MFSHKFLHKNLVVTALDFKCSLSATSVKIELARPPILAGGVNILSSLIQQCPSVKTGSNSEDTMSNVIHNKSSTPGSFFNDNLNDF